MHQALWRMSGGCVDATVGPWRSLAAMCTLSVALAAVDLVVTHAIKDDSDAAALLQTVPGRPAQATPAAQAAAAKNLAAGTAGPGQDARQAPAAWPQRWPAALLELRGAVLARARQAAIFSSQQLQVCVPIGAIGICILLCCCMRAGSRRRQRRNEQYLEDSVMPPPRTPGPRDSLPRTAGPRASLPRTAPASRTNICC
uniref:Uncharacterized protein n=1 Tax=Alexandrium monilatum TaxID=311494 RepID=A0A7S4QG53_9DINO